MDLTETFIAYPNNISIQTKQVEQLVTTDLIQIQTIHHDDRALEHGPWGWGALVLISLGRHIGMTKSPSILQKTLHYYM